MIYFQFVIFFVFFWGCKLKLTSTESDLQDKKVASTQATLQGGHGRTVEEPGVGTHWHDEFCIDSFNVGNNVYSLGYKPLYKIVDGKPVEMKKASQGTPLEIITTEIRYFSLGGESIKSAFIQVSYSKVEAGDTLETKRTGEHFFVLPEDVADNNLGLVGCDPENIQLKIDNVPIANGACRWKAETLVKAGLFDGIFDRCHVKARRMRCNCKRKCQGKTESRKLGCVTLPASGWSKNQITENCSAICDAASQ